MSNEDTIVDVDGCSSRSELSSDDDGIEIDVEADDSSDQNEAGGASGSNSGSKAGGGNLMGLTEDDLEFGPNKRDHHNELEKKRRRQLGASYSRLRKHVKRIRGSCSGGRDKTLEVANKLALQEVLRLRRLKQQAKDMVEELRAAAANSTGAELEELKEGIEELTALTQENDKVLSPAEVEKLADAETGGEGNEEITDDSDMEDDDDEEEEEEDSSEKENDNDDDASNSSYHFENQ